MFFIALSLLLVISYIILSYFFAYFFEGHMKNTKLQFSHGLIIFLVFFICIGLTFYFFDGELQNRVQHALGGGFIMTLVVYLSVQASGVKMSIFQFFMMSLLIATAFGVANELAESVLQMQFGRAFTGNIYDTWMDLWANSVGATLGSLLFSFIISKNK